MEKAIEIVFKFLSSVWLLKKILKNKNDDYPEGPCPLPYIIIA